MKKKKKIITNPPLTPSYHGEKCLGNGTHEGIECCCDECDYYLECFPHSENEKAENEPEPLENIIGKKGLIL